MSRMLPELKGFKKAIVWNIAIAVPWENVKVGGLKPDSR